MDAKNEQHRDVRLAQRASAGLEDIIDQNARAYRLQGQPAFKFAHPCFLYVGAVSNLGMHYHARGMWLFHFTIKFHYLLHIGLDCTEINPRVGWCYGGEDMMRIVKIVVQSCARGTAPQALVGKVGKKYMVGLPYESIRMLAASMWA